MKNTIDLLSKISYELEEKLNNCWKFGEAEDEIIDGEWCCYIVGENRVFDRVYEGQIVTDYRNPKVDIIVAESARDFLVKNLKEFCVGNINYDEVTMAIGCALNIYYVCGLFERLGSLNLDEIVDVVEDDTIIEYIRLEEKLLFSQIVKYCLGICKELLLDREGNELLRDYVENKETRVTDFEIFKHIDEDECTEITDAFLKCILKEKEIAQRVNLDYRQVIDEMLELKPEIQFANIYKCMLKIRQCYSEGKRAEFSRYLNLLDKDVVDMVFNMKKQWVWEEKYGFDEQRMLVSENLLRFGIGLPYMEIVDRERLIEKKLGVDVNIEIDECYAWNVGELYSKWRYAVSEGLMLPYMFVIDKVEVVNKLLNRTIQLENTVHERDKAIIAKRKVINGFSHRYKGMRATGLQNVAQSLLKKEDTELKNYGRQLMYECGIKKNLTKEVEMLQLRFEDRKEELQEKLKGSICTADEEGVTIEKIVSDALYRCMVTLVYDISQHADNMRANFEGFDLIEIRNSFEKNVVFIGNPNVIEWFNKDVFQINTFMSTNWKDIRFKDEDYAALLLTGLLTELFFNVFKYADKTKSVSVEFVDDNEAFIIEIKNQISETYISLKGSGFGLEAEGETLDIINKVNGLKGKAIEVHSSENNFETRVRLGKVILKK